MLPYHKRIKPKKTTPPSTSNSIQKLCMLVNRPATPPNFSWIATDPPAPTPKPLLAIKASIPLLNNSLRHSREPPTSISPFKYNVIASTVLAISFILGFSLSLNWLMPQNIPSTVTQMRNNVAIFFFTTTR